MKKKVIPIAVLTIAAVVLTVVIVNRHRQFLYAGTVEATEVDISARISAVIGDILVREGEDVKKGAVLAKLTSEDINVAAGLAEREFKRGQALVKAGSIDEGNFDRIRAKYEDANARLSWLTLSAPEDSTVVIRYHEPGEMVNPGMKILRLARLDTVWAYVYVPQPMLGKLSLGMKVNGTVSDSDMRQISGSIIKINSEAEFTPKNVQTQKERTRLVYGIKIEFNNKDRYLKPGMTVEIKLPELD